MNSPEFKYRPPDDFDSGGKNEGKESSHHNFATQHAWSEIKVGNDMIERAKESLENCEKRSDLYQEKGVGNVKEISQDLEKAKEELWRGENKVKFNRERLAELGKVQD